MRTAAILFFITMFGGVDFVAAQLPRTVIPLEEAARGPNFPRTTTKPTTPAKIKALKPLRSWLVGSAQTWSFTELDGEAITGAEIVGIEGNILTVKEGADRYLDVAMAELWPIERVSVERVDRLLRDRPLPDERELIGTWHVVDPPTDAIERNDPNEGRLFVTGLYLKVAAAVFSDCWVVDAASRPKRLDYGCEYPQRSIRAIYELDRDELRLCLGRRPGLPRPTKFADDENQIVRTYRRVQDLLTLPVLGADKVDPEITAAIKEMIALIEANKLKEFLDRYIDPKLVAETPPEDLAKFYAAEPTMKRRMLYCLKGMLRIQPTLDETKTSAKFDFAPHHTGEFADEMGAQPLEKIDGRWRFGMD